MIKSSKMGKSRNFLLKKSKTDGFAQGNIKKGERIFSRLPFKKLIAVILVLNLLIISLIFIFKNNLPPELPLFYGLPEGEDQLASTIALIIPSIISVSILIINSTISLFVNNEFLKKTLVASILITSFFSIIATFKIFLLVGSF